MALSYFQCTDFRCLASAELTPKADHNLVIGPNASGKTSLLEAIACLGRGRSFRGAATADLVRQGTREFILYGRTREDGREHSLGLRNGSQGLEIRIDGQKGLGTAALAEALPLQVVDPDVHNLVAGGPEYRRKFLDWIGFHVEHGYLELWRRFRRVLRQRNAGLRDGGSRYAAWDREFAERGEDLHRARQRVFESVLGELRGTGERLLESTVAFEYRPGWRGESLAEALVDCGEREQRLGSSQAGPQRADLRLVYDDGLAKRLVSRGQQKLLACALILAGGRQVQAALGRSILLLLDDPAAELDGGSLSRLMGEVVSLECQVIATALKEDSTLFPGSPALFHVERGRISPG